MCRVLKALSSAVLTRTFGVAPGRKLTGTIFRQLTELMGTIDPEFIGNSTFPPFILLPYPFHMGILFFLGERLASVFWSTQGCEKLAF